MIKRINELYHKSQAGGLTEQEKEEQMKLRREYVAKFRNNLRAQLDNIDFLEADGTITSAGERSQAKGKDTHKREK
jgi:5-formyltetrahydrofolate cyclo-ligase